MKNQAAAIALHELSPARVFARPTADDLWLGPAQASALSQLAAPVPLKVLLGPTSSGRTTLLRHLAAAPDGDVVSLSARGPHRVRKSLLKALLESAGMQTDGLGREESRRLIGVYIREQHARGRRVLLQIDDAERLGRAAFDELIRLRRSASTDGSPPEILLSLVHIDAESSPAAQYIRSSKSPAVTVLSWLRPAEVRLYILWRMQRFGLGEVFSDAAINMIARCTHGCFAAIDHLCQMSLLLLRNRELTHVDVLLVREALRALKRQRLTRDASGSALHEAEVIVTRDGELIHRSTIGPRLLIGRSRLNDIPLDSAYLSRHHLAIVRGASGYCVNDLNSVNGVLLNGRRIQSAPVGNEDVIRIGPFRIKLVVAEDALLQRSEDQPEALAETTVMPTPGIPEPAHLKVVK